jgi:hypothetical protein
VTFFALPHATTLPGPEALTYLRAREIFEAAHRLPDVEVVELLQQTRQDGVILETIVIDLCCDRVPSRNAVGIRYRERLALRVSPDLGRLPEVFALRRAFPLLIHTNHVDADHPVHLCLYFDSARAVLRTWTAAGFVNRIRWWLEQAARGELHPADQPLEHLFFDSPHDLILPWNMDALRHAGVPLYASHDGPREDGGYTIILRPSGPAAPQHQLARLVDLELPAIVHGLVERDPSTIEDLRELLARRGVDLIAHLKDTLSGIAGEQGASGDQDDSMVVLLLHVPMKLTEDAAPSAMAHRGYLVFHGGLAIGGAVGALFKLEGFYYSSVAVETPVDAEAMRKMLLIPMNVLRRNQPADARRQAGIAEEGPSGIVVGAGSLGSALLNIWGREGWGQWTAVDKDHIRPHNLSRHTANAHHVGQMKAKVVAQLHDRVMLGASTITPVVADVVERPNELLALLTHTELVVDASTTLEFPRSISAVDGVARHMSVFVTPAGNASVLLAEDADRRVRLRTLEAQYYRALITQEWGATHLPQEPGAFWSGGSCRDLSLVLPYSHILAHAATLAEQIPSARADAEARIRVWQRETATGAVVAHNIPTFPERQLRLGDTQLSLDEGLVAHLHRMRIDALPNETGGMLLGYYDFNIQAVVVVLALPAPPDSVATPHSFERGTDGVIEAVQQATQRTAGMVGYLGEWHSHPTGHGARASRDDLIQLTHLALGMSADGLPAVQLIVGDQGDLQVLQAHVV